MHYVIHCKELETSDFLAVFTAKCQELNAHLNMMAWNLFVEALGVNLPQARIAR